jgi:hypothetical protein
MGTQYLPRRDADLLVWSTNFVARIEEYGSAIGLTDPQVLGYTALQEAYAAAYALIQDGATRSPSNIVLKDQARKLLIAQTRILVGIAQKFPGTSDAMRTAMKINVRKIPARKNRPTEMPKIDVLSIVNRIVSLKLSDAADPDNKGLPADALGANVYTFVGDEPPTDPKLWQTRGTITRTRGQIEIEGTAAATVWITAAWFNSQGTGPGRYPFVQANVAEVKETPVANVMKIAA